MNYDGKYLARAREKLEQRRSDNRAEHGRRVAQVYTHVPEIALIDNTLRKQMTELIRLTLAHPKDLVGRLDALKKENLDLQARKAELLVGNGWPIDYLDEIFTCPLCHDAGMVKSEICGCLTKLYNRELTDELSTLLRRGDESFDRFDLTLYDEGIDANGNRPRSTMSVVLALAREFAANFPKVSSNLLLQGGTGLGKTYLSACIAREVADKGYSVCYDSAISALDAFEQQKFARNPETAADAARRVQQMLSCDLMILDDLGTELTTSVALSSIYQLVNTRLVNGRRSIISTNLSDEELERRYGQQIYSRLKGEFRCLPFVGRDIRRKQ